MKRYVLVYGAHGHTGRFVVAELLRQGLTPILSGRDSARLGEMAGQFPGLEVRAATVGDSHSLDSAVRGAAVVVNCAGPFLDTAVPIAAAAVRAGAHYLDVTAEQPAVQQVYRAHEELAWRTDVAVIPAMAFYGGLADLLATDAAAGWETVDAITVAIGLDRWWPTEGTRNTGRRNTATRLVVDGGRLAPAPSPAPRRDWEFPPPLERQTVAGTPFAEIITIARHLAASRIDTYLATVALEDIRNPATPAPGPSMRPAAQRNSSPSTSLCAAASRSAVFRRPGATSTPSRHRLSSRRPDGSSTVAPRCRARPRPARSSTPWTSWTHSARIT
jgi:saccharopine dehydrogenase-like NADP-dependent oxidoreductase